MTRGGHCGKFHEVGKTLALGLTLGLLAAAAPAAANGCGDYRTLWEDSAISLPNNKYVWAKLRCENNCFVMYTGSNDFGGFAGSGTNCSSELENYWSVSACGDSVGATMDPDDVIDSILKFCIGAYLEAERSRRRSEAAAAPPKQTLKEAYLSGNHARVLEIVRPRAEQGDAEAEFLMGGIYKDGSGVEADAEKAFEWYRRSAEHGFATSQKIVAMLYYKGEGVAQDVEEGLRWDRMAAGQGDAHDQFSLAMSLLTGLYVPPDPVEAAEWFRKAAEQGDEQSQIMLGQLLAEGTDDEAKLAEAAVWLRKGAESGDVDSAFLLGRAYYLGKGVAEDDDQALRWILAAAEQGHAEAAYLAGRLYEKRSDLTSANKWFKAGMELGYGASAQAYAENLFYGRGVAKDVRGSMEIMIRFAEKGHYDSLYILTMLFDPSHGGYDSSFGEIIAPDLRRATRYYMELARRHDSKEAASYLVSHALAEDAPGLDLTEVVAQAERLIPDSKELAILKTRMKYAR